MNLRIYFLAFFIMLFAEYNLNAQTDLLAKRIDSLITLDTNWRECNSVFWRIVASGKPAVPLLITKLTDTAKTTAKDKCKYANLCVGDLAYLALKEIIPLPFFTVTGMQCDMIVNGCDQYCSWGYIEDNRPKFQRQVRLWYATEEKNFRLVQFTEREATPCYQFNHIIGHYEYR